MRNTWMRTTLVLVLLLLLPVACKKPPVRRIVCFGDSLTAGPHLPARDAYPARLERILHVHGYNYEVVNAGLSGDTSEGGVERVESVLGMQTDIFILELGTNDILRGEPVDSIRASLSQIIRKVQSRNVTVVLAAIPAPADFSAEYRAQVSGLYRALAGEYRTPLMGDFMREVRSAPDTLRADGIHYNAKGADILARSVYRKIRPLLSR